MQLVPLMTEIEITFFKKKWENLSANYEIEIRAWCNCEEALLQFVHKMPLYEPGSLFPIWTTNSIEWEILKINCNLTYDWKWNIHRNEYSTSFYNVLNELNVKTVYFHSFNPILRKQNDVSAQRLKVLSMERVIRK